MKKLIAMLIALAVCCAMVLPVAAEEFVPSISYKDHPEIVDTPVIKDEAQEEVKDVEVVITPVAGALDKPEEEQNPVDKNLINIYEKLESGDMKLPVTSNEDKIFVIRDLFDISVVDNNGNKVDDVATVEVTFDLGLEKDKEVVIMVYENDEWHVVEDVTHNVNGSVTIVFDKLGPVAFCVEEDAHVVPPTNDKMTQEVITWSILMIASACAAVVMLISRRKARQ